nr:MAG TPA: hypothetical protein [Caudoviricetes sp.]
MARMDHKKGSQKCNFQRLQSCFESYKRLH